MTTSREPHGFAGRLVRDSAVYGAAGILTRATTILLLPLYTRLLLPGEIGQIELLTIASSLVHVTVALEISQGLARHLPESSNREERHAFASTAFVFTLVTYGLMAVLGLLLAPWAAEVLFGASTGADLVRIAAGAAFTAGAFQILLAELRYELNPRGYALVSIAFTAISVGGTAALVGVVRTGPAGVFVAQGLAAAVGTLLALRATTEVLPIRRFDGLRLRQMLSFSLPLVPSSVGVFVALSVDRIAIGQLMSISDVGLFSVGYRVAQAVSLLMVGFQLALTPLIYQRHADPRTPIELERIFRAFVGFALVICLGLGLFGRTLLTVLATATYAPAAGVIAILAPALLLANMYIFAPGLGIAMRTGTIAFLSLGTAVLNTALAFSLIPAWGIYGAATATLISSTANFLGYMILSQRTYFVPHRWPRLFIAAVMTVAMLVLGLVLDLPPVADVAFRIALLMIATGAVVALGLIEPSAIRAIYRKLKGPLVT